MSLMTNSILLTPTGWTDLGAGPLSVVPHGLEAADVVLALSDVPPPSSLTEGEPLRGTRFFGATTHVWALALGQPGRIVVTAPDVGGASGGGLGYAASGRGPVAGTFAATGQSASFAPLAGRAFNISLWGTFTSTIQLERSFDGGMTWLPITAAGAQLYKWTAPASESNQDDEANVQYRLDCTVFTSGAASYRISQ